MQFFEAMDIQPGQRVLDVACGAGQLSLPVARAGAVVTGVDIASNLDIAMVAQLKFSDVCDRYMDSKVQLRDSTRKGYLGLIECYLKPYFGPRRLTTVSVVDIEKYRAALVNGIPPAIEAAALARTRAAKPKLSAARAKRLVASRRVV